MPPMKYWEIIADKPGAAGWSLGYCSAVTADGQRSCGPILGNCGNSALSTRYIRYYSI